MKKKMFYLLIPLMLSFIVYGTAFGKGMASEPGPGCPAVLPEPTSGPILAGTFTASHDLDVCAGYAECVYYQIHFTLAYRGKMYNFSGNVKDDSGAYILTDATSQDIKDLAAWVPCSWGQNGLQEVFGLTGYPVIYNVYILKRDFPNTAQEMISGTITVRVVPAPPVP